MRAPDGSLLYYRGQRNIDAMIADLRSNHGLSEAKEVIVSGCSAGGMACYLHCDNLAEALSPIPVKCVCDAGAKGQPGRGMGGGCGGRCPFGSP